MGLPLPNTAKPYSRTGGERLLCRNLFIKFYIACLKSIYIYILCIHDVQEEYTEYIYIYTHIYIYVLCVLFFAYPPTRVDRKSFHATAALNAKTNCEWAVRLGQVTLLTLSYFYILTKPNFVPVVVRMA